MSDFPKPRPSASAPAARADTPSRRRRALLRACAAPLLLPFAGAVRAQNERTGGPYVPTPQTVVDEMLRFAGVGARDFVIDLGSGDGRIVLTAAERYRARGLGVDIDAELVEQSNAEARKRGLDKLVSFRQQDVLLTPIAEATVLTLYLLPGMMSTLRGKVLSELKPGARVVSHDFEFGDWDPDRKITVNVPEKYFQAGNWTSNIYLWIVPARVAGQWRLTLADGQHMLLDLTQRYQVVGGQAQIGGRRLALREARLDGGVLRFTLRLPSGALQSFRGSVAGDTMRGEAAAAAGGVPAAWNAVRTADQAPVRS